MLSNSFKNVKFVKTESFLRLLPAYDNDHFIYYFYQRVSTYLKLKKVTAEHWGNLFCQTLYIYRLQNEEIIVFRV